MSDSAVLRFSRAFGNTRVIGQVFGGAMALILALSPLLYLMARKNDRR
jgi:hypothetical protein